MTLPTRTRLLVLEERIAQVDGDKCAPECVFFGGVVRPMCRQWHRPIVNHDRLDVCIEAEQRATEANQ